MMMPELQTEHRIGEHATLDRLLGAATGQRRHCQLEGCTAWAPTRTVTTRHNGDRVSLDLCSACFKRAVFDRDASALARSAAVQHRLQRGVRVQSSAPAAPAAPAVGWRQQIDALRRRMPPARPTATRRQTPIAYNPPAYRGTSR